MSSFCDLYNRLDKTDSTQFYSLEGKFFLAFYSGFPQENRPDCVVAFMAVSSWLGSSLRSGVWTYYEVADPKEIERTVHFLDKSAPQEFTKMFRYGVHDYQNPIYREHFNYPKIWIQESETIDEWIAAHEALIAEWQRTILLQNKDLICSFHNE